MSESGKDKEDKSTLGKISGSLERILKIAGALVVIAYVFGIVVVNVRLGRYGYHSLGLLELEYVVAGFWALTPVAFAYLLISFIVLYVGQDALYGEEGGDKSKKSIEDTLTAVFAGVFVWVILLVLFFSYADVTFNGNWAWAVLIGFFVGSGSILLPVMVSEFKGSRARVILGALALILLLTAVPFYLVFFGSYLYETIPDRWGGGRMSEVVLVAKDDDARTLLELGGVQFTDNRRSAPVRLILATEKQLFILPPQQPKGVELNHDLVTAVIYK